MRAHGPRETDDLLGPLTLHRQADEQGRELRGSRLARHHEIHGRSGLVGRQVLVPRQLHQQVGQHGVLVYLPSRKLRSMRRPSDVRTDSGWNWTPCSGQVLWRRPMMMPSPRLRAETSSTSGRPCSSTISEWYRDASIGLASPAKTPRPSCSMTEVLPCIGTGARTTRPPHTSPSAWRPRHTPRIGTL